MIHNILYIYSCFFSPTILQPLSVSVYYYRKLSMLACVSSLIQHFTRSHRVPCLVSTTSLYRTCVTLTTLSIALCSLPVVTSTSAFMRVVLVILRSTFYQHQLLYLFRYRWLLSMSVLSCVILPGCLACCGNVGACSSTDRGFVTQCI
jgi:hypothetical protein